jgi:hypothetical protein
MLRAFLLRSRSYTPVAILVAAACAPLSCSSSSLELARGRATVVTLENARYDPPRSIGLVSANHPGAQHEDADLRRSGFKRADVGVMDALLDHLEEQGLLQCAVRVEAVRPLDPGTQLARLTVTVDRQIIDFTVPRRPPKELADRYTQMARAVSEVFNVIVDLRPSREEANGDLFLDMQQRLYESNAEKLKVPAKPGGSP